MVSTGIIPGVFDIVTCWYVCGVEHIFVGAVGVDAVWVVFVSFGVTLSALVPNFLANFCKASLCLPWKV